MQYILIIFILSILTPPGSPSTSFQLNYIFFLYFSLSLSALSVFSLPVSLSVCLSLVVLSVFLSVSVSLACSLTQSFSLILTLKPMKSSLCWLTTLGCEACPGVRSIFHGPPRENCPSSSSNKMPIAPPLGMGFMSTPFLHAGFYLSRT